MLQNRAQTCLSGHRKLYLAHSSRLHPPMPDLSPCRQTWWRMILQSLLKSAAHMRTSPSSPVLPASRASHQTMVETDPSPCEEKPIRIHALLLGRYAALSNFQEGNMFCTCKCLRWKISHTLHRQSPITYCLCSLCPLLRALPSHCSPLQLLTYTWGSTVLLPLWLLTPRASPQLHHPLT